MSLTDRSNRRCVPVRLTDLPLDVRIAAYRVAMRYARTPEECMELAMAAAKPSDTIYWVAQSAIPTVHELKRIAGIPVEEAEAA